MNNLDDEIRDALEAEQREVFDEDEDFQAHYESLKVLFRGRTKWLTVLQLALMGVFLTLIVVSIVQFFRVESMRAMIAWAAGFAVSVCLAALTELYFMMEWNKYVLRWDVKQLELQVASLESRVARASSRASPESPVPGPTHDDPPQEERST